MTAVAILSALGVWKWRASRKTLGGQPDALDAMIGTRTFTGTRASALQSGPRGSVLAQRRSVLSRMSNASARKSVVDGTKSFQTCISRNSEILNADDLDEVIELEEEEKKEREEDLEKIRSLRSRFDEASGQDPRKARWLEDNDILRYVRARPTLDESEALLKTALDWRCAQEKVWGVDLANGSWGHMYDHYQNRLHDAPDWWAFLYRHLHCTIYGEDSFDIPITYVHFAKQDLQGVVREVGSDKLVQFMVYFTDYFLDCVRNQYLEDVADDEPNARFKHGGIVIIDLDGATWANKGDIAEFSKPGNISKFLHCERQRRSFIVNAPRIFSLCWKIVSPMIDARARDKMNIIAAGGSMQPLIDELGENLIPICLGGTMPDIPSRPSGPIPKGAFEQFRKEHEQQRSDHQQRKVAETASGAKE